MNEVALVDKPKPNIVAGARPMAIVPKSMDEVYRLSQAVHLSGLAPKDLNSPEKAMIAIMHGLEVGLAPMAALQRIAVVNGRPTIWGDGALGLVRGSGACEYIKEWIDGEDDTRVAYCEVKRRGEPEPITRKFSVGDAKKASLFTKSGPWQQYPERMLQMRARAFALRDGFADVLGGLYIAEELTGTDPSNDHTPPTPPVPPRATPALAAPSASLAPPSPPKPTASVGPVDLNPLNLPSPKSDPEIYIKAVDAALASFSDDQGEAATEWFFNSVAPNVDELLPPDQEQVSGLLRKHERRWSP